MRFTIATLVWVGGGGALLTGVFAAMRAVFNRRRFVAWARQWVRVEPDEGCRAR